MNHTAKKLLVGTVGAAGLFLATTATANADTTHKVAKNDTVWDLSQKYGVSIQAIEALNNIDQNSHLIVTGQTLKVPAKDAQVSENNNTAQAADKKADTENTSDVTVKAGDTLWTLAQQYNTSVEKLRELNGLAADAYLIHPGNVLKVNGTVQATQQPAQTEQPVQQQTEQPVVQQEATQEQAQEPQLVVSANHTTHTVQAGESLYSIAQAYGVTVDSLRSANNLGATLLVGQTLTINDPAKDPAQEAAAQQAAQEQAAAQAQQEAATQQAAQEQAAAAQAQQQVQQPVQNQAPAQTQTQAPAQQTQQVQQQAQPAQVQQPQQQVVSTSADGSAIAAYAQSFIGTPYVWGGSTPSGFDCSGLTQYVYAHFGKQIGRNTIAQESAGTHIPVSQAQVGDLLFWGTPGSTYHVAIYLGGNSFVAAPEPGQSVKIGNMAYFMPSFAVHVN
ncbi:LysM peptidoglycan-binding domain-containing protein [Ligilactobacillus animalis]|uniref:Spore coat assembly protein SafA, safA n=1 Tax=Ligilactobacillus animalis TaxID=1605 RepID=A0ABR4RRS6_9LACO|nr:C40 family peptidase [Ligilactobacillus animalis]KDA46778.1 spore coat assembly protein SafA, safA [Ligilactobacillus animalis]MEE0260856.1 LysM peptidoglycan-binding domain-containing protein [Ligilactobacillus animalis]PNQ51768.1 peptidoglycan endopeptidase [Ligilactobacillus animalis]